MESITDRDQRELTFVFTICRRRVLELGRSPAPTRATSEVQNSISTIDVAPSPKQAAEEYDQLTRAIALSARWVQPRENRRAWSITFVP